MTRAILYYKKIDSEIEKLLVDVEEVCKKNELEFLPIDIDLIADKDSFPIKSTPCITVGPYTLKYPFTLTEVEIACQAAVSRHIESKPEPLERAKTKNRIGLFLSRWYSGIIAAILILFVGGAVAAPFNMRAGNERTAQALYRFYRVFCHQLAFRSYFIGGTQLFYPRTMAGMENLVSYEEEFSDHADDVDIAREIVGNPESGYKIALCQRDLAIYSSLAVVAIIFQIFRKKLKPIRWYFWFIIALIPIGLDGFSQIPGLSSGWPTWFPIRESTPLLRSITGILFGGMTGLYMFPMMEESMEETNQLLKIKREIINAELSRIKKHG